VIPNGVDAERFNPQVTPDIIRARHNLGSSKVVLFVGALTKWHTYKGLDVLLNAFKIASRQRDLRLVIVGGGPLEIKYRALSHQLGVDSRVTFAGAVDGELLPKYYAACDLAVLPSTNSSEGFGLVLLEAMATGKPVIGSRIGGVPDVIRDGEDGLLVEPNDTKGLARAIALLEQNDEMRMRMGANGRRFAVENDWSVVAARVESLYQEIL
jgi:glycosyltransferase involved in cell wall biosynthesis